LASRSAPRLLNPVSDEVTDEYAVYASSTDVVALTAPVAAFLEFCDHERIRPVLLTGADVRLTAACATMLTDIRGFWAVQGPGGVVEAATGRPLTKFADLWLPHEASRPQVVHADGLVSITLDAYVRHRADNATRIGAVAELAAAALDAPLPDRWGVWEPFGRRWHTDALTGFLRAQMPQTGPVHAVGEGTTFVTQRVGRTRRGLLEHLRFSARPRSSEDLHGQATALLTHLEESADVEIAVVTTRTSEADGTVRPGGYPATAPLAALLGPRATHHLGIDTAALAQRHRVSSLGRARTPSTLIDFGGTENPWHRLLDLGLALEPDRVLSTLGVEVPDAG
jgi:hypothetical protein